MIEQFWKHEKERFMECEKKTQKILISWAFICVALCMIFIVVYKYNSMELKEFALDENTISDLPDYYEYGIDPINIENGIVTITGWAVNKNENLDYVNRKILLFDEDNTIVEVKTASYDRNLTWFLNNGHNYDYGGIIGKCQASQLEENKKYFIHFLVIESDQTQYLIDTHTVLEI